MTAIFATILNAVQTEINSPDHVSYAPVTWAPLTLVGALIAVMYADLRKQISVAIGRANTHGHKIKMECHNKTCAAEVETVGGALINDNESK
jgi:hypothetical protein